MSEYVVTDTELTAMANAIRAKTGDSSAIEFEANKGFADAIADIPSGGGGSTNVLSGTTAPTSQEGSNGSIYLKHLPSQIEGYDFIEYLQSSGTQRIDTGVPARVQLKTEIDCQWAGSGDQTVLGGSSSVNDNAIYLGYNSSNGKTYVGYAGSWHDFASGAVNQNRHLWEIDLQTDVQEFHVDGARFATTLNTFTETTSAENLNLFARSNGNMGFVGKIYNVKIYDYLDNCNLIRDFVPVKRQSDNELGLYDLVNGVFYDNDGTGDFSGGSVVNMDPVVQNTYTKVSGAWQNLIGTSIEDINLGGGSAIDLSYLPNSTAANVIASADWSMCDNKTTIGNIWAVPIIDARASHVSLDIQDNAVIVPIGLCLSVPLSGADVDATYYVVAKNIGTSSRESFVITATYAYGTGCTPAFYSSNGTKVQKVTYGSYNPEITGVSAKDYHIYAISLNQATKKARYYFDGAFSEEISFSHSGGYITMFRGAPDSDSYDDAYAFKYGGVIAETESDATIIANMQVIMQKLGIS